MSKTKTLALVASIVGTSLFSSSAFAQWQVHKFAEVTMAGSDNRFQSTVAPADAEEFVGSVKPSVELMWRGNRFDTDVNAEVEYYRFGEEERDIVDPRLAISTEGMIVNNLLYVKSRLDVAKVYPGDVSFRLVEEPEGEEAETRSRLRFSPFIAREFGSGVDLYFGYGHQSLDNESDGDVDYQIDSLGFSLAQNPNYGKVLLGIGADIVRDKNDGVTFQSGSYYASLGTSAIDDFYIEARIGQEFDDYFDVIGDEDLKPIAELGVTWSPSENMEFNVGYVDRFYSTGPVFSIKRNTEVSQFLASYTRGSAVNDVIIDPDTAVAALDGDDPSLSVNGIPLVEERFRLQYKLRGRRSDLVFDGDYKQRSDRQGQQAVLDTFTGSVAFDRHLSRTTTLRVQYEHELSDAKVERFKTFDENRLLFKLLFNFDQKARPGSWLALEPEE